MSPASPDHPQLESVAARLRAIEESLGFIEHGSESVGLDLASLSTRVRALEHRLTDLERRLAEQRGSESADDGDGEGPFVPDVVD